MLSAIKNASSKICIALGLSMAFAATAAHAEKLPLEGVTLNVAFAITPPFVQVEPGSLNNITGIDVEMVRELQRRTGFKLKDNRFEVMNFGDMTKQAADGLVDIAASGVYLTEARSKIYAFSPPYYKTAMGVMASKNSGINSFEDLQNKTISAMIGSTATDAIPKELNIQTKEMQSPTSFMAFYEVAVGKADVAIADVPVIQDFMNNLLGDQMSLRFVVPNSEAEMGMLFNKKSPYVPILQQTMKDMILDGTAGKIVAQFSNDPQANIAQITYEKALKAKRRDITPGEGSQITSVATNL